MEWRRPRLITTHILSLATCIGGVYARAHREEATRERDRKGFQLAQVTPTSLHLSQHSSVALPLLPLCLASFTCPPHSPTWPPQKCRSLFNQAIHLASIVRLFFLFLFFPALSLLSSLKLCHIGPLTQNVKRSLSITNPNADPISFKIKTTAPKVRHFYHATPSLPLIFSPSYTASDPTQERSSLARQLKFKVQPLFCCSKRLTHRPA